MRRLPLDSGSWSLWEPKGAGKFRRLPHHICTNCTLAIGEFTLHIWRDTHVPKIAWTPGTTADANARKAELYQYAIVGSDGADANDNSHIWTETFTFEAYDRGMELARLAAAIQLGHDLHDVQIIPSDLYAACTKLMEVPKNIVLHQTETNTTCWAATATLRVCCIDMFAYPHSLKRSLVLIPVRTRTKMLIYLQHCTS